MKRRDTISTIIDSALRKQSVNELSITAQNLLSLLTIVVDIQYRHKYGKSLDRRDGKGY